MGILDIDRGSFNDKVLGSKNPVLVLFTADWCGPCRALHPILEEFLTEHDGEVDIFSVDVTKYDDVAARFTVKGLPTVILFRDGEEIDRFAGLKTKDALEEMLSAE